MFVVERACDTRECVRALDGYARSHAERWNREDDLDDGASILTRVTARREIVTQRHDAAICWSRYTFERGNWSRACYAYLQLVESVVRRKGERR